MDLREVDVSSAGDVADFNLSLGPEDVWASPLPPVRGCRDESECEMQPWCRIDQRCHRLLPKPELIQVSASDRTA